MVIAIQGEKGSYHHIAASSYFSGAPLKFLCYASFLETYQALLSGKADYAVAALHNTIHGEVTRSTTVHAQYKTQLQTMDTIDLPVHHCLIGLPGTRLSNVRYVHSQVEALNQCGKFLDRILPVSQKIESDDTAGSVAFVKDKADTERVAIGSALAAEMHGLDILAQNIEDCPDNITTFQVLQRRNNSLTIPQTQTASILL